MYKTKKNKEQEQVGPTRKSMMTEGFVERSFSIFFFHRQNIQNSFNKIRPNVVVFLAKTK